MKYFSYKKEKKKGGLDTWGRGRVDFATWLMVVLCILHLLNKRPATWAAEVAFGLGHGLGCLLKAPYELLPILVTCLTFGKGIL